MADGSDLIGHLTAIHCLCAEAHTRHAGDGGTSTLFADINALATGLQRTRQDLIALGIDDLLGRHVPAATDELDAIVTHTAEAACNILDECESLERASTATSCHPMVVSATRRIYEACCFQDITGQRMAKVVRTLGLIEARMADMLRILGCAPASSAAPVERPGLLNGPGHPQHAMGQAGVDAFFESVP